MDGWLSTHVLDTGLGRPAAGLRIELFRLTGEAREQLADVVTNADGRSDAPLLKGEAFQVGTYELVFHAGAYLRGCGIGGEVLFLDLVPIRFGISEGTAHYHVPLLLSPFGYSTYRGS